MLPLLGRSTKLRYTLSILVIALALAWVAALLAAYAGRVVALVVWGPLVLGGGGRLLDEGDAKFEAWNVDWVQHALTSSDSHRRSAQSSAAPAGPTMSIWPEDL